MAAGGFFEAFVTQVEVVRTAGRRGKKVRPLDHPGVIVEASWIPRGRLWRVIAGVAARHVEDPGAADRVQGCGGTLLDREAPAGVLRLDEQRARPQAVVVERQQRVGRPARDQAREVEDVRVEGEVLLLMVHVEIRRDEMVSGGDRPGQFAFESSFVGLVGVGDRLGTGVAGERRRSCGQGLGGIGLASRREKPQPVPHQAAAEDGLVSFVRLVHTVVASALPIERVVGAPAVVGERGAHGATEFVATGLRDRLDDAAREPAVLEPGDPRSAPSSPRWHPR